MTVLLYRLSRQSNHLGGNIRDYLRKGGVLDSKDVIVSGFNVLTLPF